MAERLTEEQMDLLAVDVTHRADRWVRDRVLDLIAEVRERRAADGEYCARHGARILELEAALRECVADNDGLFSLGVQAETWDHGSGDEAIAAKVDAEERALAILDRARAALAKGESNETA